LFNGEKWKAIQHMKKIPPQTPEKEAARRPVGIQACFGSFLLLYKIVMKPTWKNEASQTPGVATLPRVSLGVDRG
jgi:hypothetical protein